MKKILILADINSAHTEKWVKVLIEKDYIIHLFSLSTSYTKWHLKLNNFSYSSQKKNDSNSLTSKLIYLKGIPHIKKIVKEFQPDFVHAHYASSYGLLGSLIKFSPYYVSVWGSDVFDFPTKNSITKFTLKYVLKKADKIFSTGNLMAQEIKKYTNKKIEIVSFGVDTNSFIPSKYKKNEILTIGLIKSLESIYGVDILIKAFAEVLKSHTNLNLRIVGGGSLEKEYKQLVFELGINEFVDFVGKVPYNEIVSEYQKLDIFVNPSRFESFGVSILEASACGLAVIATNSGGQVELVKENETGLLVEPENIKELAGAIITLIENEALRNEFGTNARAFVINNFNLNSSIQSLIKHY